jgi:hypothetical protein
MRVFLSGDEPFARDAAAHPGTTPAGRPWVRWARVGDAAGYLHDGTKLPGSADGADSFVGRVIRIGAAIGNTSLDAVHCVGDGILSVGPLGFDMTNGAAIRLLAACVDLNGSKALDIMGEVCVRSGYYFGENNLRGLGGREVVAAPCSENIIRGGTGGKQARWNPNNKKRAHEWVESIARLLREVEWKPLHPTILEVLQRQLPAELLHQTLGLPDVAVSEYMYAVESRAVAAVVLALAYKHQEKTTTLLTNMVGHSAVGEGQSLGEVRLMSLRFRARQYVREGADEFGRDLQVALQVASEVFGIRQTTEDA